MYGDPSEPDPEVLGVHREMPAYTREWSFDPYHQAMRFAKAHAPEHADADTEWRVWEVFQQRKRGEHHAHVGAVHAPDAELAMVLAKESFARRGLCVNLWVVPAASIHATDYADADVFELTTDRMYREPGGFRGLRKNVQGMRKKSAAAEAEAADDHVSSVLHAAEEAEAAKKGRA
jgi:ring-1,2-phenylacetyl-CoA epoxidase subunit PaaB